MKSGPSLLFIRLLSMMVAAPTFGNYTFLGNVTRIERDGARVVAFCEGSHELHVEFLLPEMFRVTLQRADQTEPLLSYPIAKPEWAAVPLEIRESETVYSVRTAGLEVQVSKKPCRLIVRNHEGEILCEDNPGLGMGWDGNEVRVWKTLAADERFFGLGLKTGHLDKRGQEWEMWNTDHPAYDYRTDPLYQSIPFFVGVRGGEAYGIYFNNSSRTRFNLGAGNRRYYSFAAEQGSLDYFFIYGPRIPAVVERYTELTGRAPMPPMWALGYQQCRWSYYPDDEVRRIAQTFREKKIPADVLYLDIHYMDGYRLFTWDSTRFPDPRKLTRELGDMGFKVVTIIDPGVKVDSLYRVAREGLAGNHFVRYPDGEVYVGDVWPGPSYFPDFSRAETRAWWGDNLRVMLDAGVRGFWNDMNEPAVWGQAFPTETIFFDEGHPSSHKRLHNLYGFLMARATYEGLLRARPNERPFILTRAGFAGEQRYAAVWTGDNIANEEHLGLGIRMMLGMGISGVPFIGTDVGGFVGTPSKELYARWIQVGALSPLFRTHTEYGSNDQEPWSFGEHVEEISRQFITRRYQLLPYFYSLFFEAHQTGAPILRPLFWHDQEDPRTYDWEFEHQFFVGEKLMAAPVVSSDEFLKKVYFPAGRWLDWNTEEIYEGKRTAVVEAPLDRLPLFLREGAIVPMREPQPYVDESPLRKLSVDLLAGDTESRFLHYEDDGLSFEYLAGKYRLTEWQCQKAGERIRFAQSRVHDDYSPPARDLELRFHAVARPPRDVLIDGKSRPDAMDYDSARRIVTVRMADDASQRTIVVR